MYYVDKAQLALKLMLDELDLQPDIRTVRERKTVQKAVYLGQAAGMDLGYRYNWYIMGPYSPALTRDYFALSESLAVEDDESTNYELQESVRSRLTRIKPLLSPPADVSLSPPEWLELLASLHYLLVQRRMPWQQALVQLREKKRHVADYADQARRELENRGIKLS